MTQGNEQDFIGAGGHLTSVRYTAKKLAGLTGLDDLNLLPEQIEMIASSVPGGIANIQDIYPLTSLQEGMLFHRLMNRRGDTYVLSMVLELAASISVTSLICAIERLIDRHDSLRTAVLWEQLPRPLQVVYRKATLGVEEVIPNGEPVEFLKERMRSQHLTFDLRKAPLLRLSVAASQHGKQWYALLQVHHLVCDHQSLNDSIGEIFASLRGHRLEASPSAAFKDLVIESRARAESDSSAAYFRAALADVDEPSAPFGRKHFSIPVHRSERRRQWRLSAQ